MPIQQHLIDPEICIRCNTCESRCPTGAISHERNYVVDFNTCNNCMKCVRPCPTGAIDNWLTLEQPFSVEEQHTWELLPAVVDPAALTVQPDALDWEATEILQVARAANLLRYLGGFPPASPLIRALGPSCPSPLPTPFPLPVPPVRQPFIVPAN